MSGLAACVSTFICRLTKEGCTPLLIAGLSPVFMFPIFADTTAQIAWSDGIARCRYKELVYAERVKIHLHVVRWIEACIEGKPADEESLRRLVFHR